MVGAGSEGWSWFEALRPTCTEACAAGGPADPATVLFYLARWCQKTSKDAEPEVTSLDQAEVSDTATRIVRNLREDAATVDRLVDGHADAWTALRALLLKSARRRAGADAGEHADEALQKIAVVLLTGTAPSRAAEQLATGPEGPANEYVFHAPFANWARSVVKNLVTDEERRAKRPREGVAVRAPQQAPALDGAVLRQAREALPGLLDAIRGLPPVQRTVMTLSLSRRDLDEAVRERLRELAPDLLPPTDDDLVSTDDDIGERLRTTPKLVAANRSAARRKLARLDAMWGLLLDVLLPHKSTRPVGVPVDAGVDPAPDPAPMASRSEVADA